MLASPSSNPRNSSGSSLQSIHVSTARRLVGVAVWFDLSPNSFTYSLFAAFILSMFSVIKLSSVWQIIYRIYVIIASLARHLNSQKILSPAQAAQDTRLYNGLIFHLLNFREVLTHKRYNTAPISTAVHSSSKNSFMFTSYLKQELALSAPTVIILKCA